MILFFKVAKNFFIVFIFLFNFELFANELSESFKGLDRCPVCKEPIYKYRDWVVFLYYEKDGKLSYLAFDGVKEFIRFYSKPSRWGDYSNIKMHEKKIVFRDYKSKKPIVSHGSWFLYGSSIKGPKGLDLIPFSKIEDAEFFLKKYNGKKILDFNDIIKIKLIE